MMSVYLVVFGSLPFSAVMEKDGSGTVSDQNISPLNMGKVSPVSDHSPRVLKVLPKLTALLPYFTL